ncbi:MAG: outer membrane protein assembly factor BamA [Bacteriovoracia bacterium]
MISSQVGSYAFEKDELGKVKQIKIHGTKKIEVDAVEAKIKTKVGDTAKRSQIRDDIKAIHSLGFFDDVIVNYEDSGVLDIEVKERPSIVKIDFEGNEQISTSDLKEVIKLRQYSILDVNKVNEDVSLIQKHYEEKGYYLARITYEVRPTTASDEVELIYKISDFDKVRIKKISFINNKRFSDEKLKSIFRNSREGGFFSFVSGSGNFKESAFKQDLEILTYFYLNEGYVRFRYEKPIITVSDDKKWLFISIYVDEGERYSVGEIDFGGDLMFSKEELAEDLTMKPKQWFAIQKHRDDMTSLAEKYQDLGYAFTNVVPKITYHDQEHVMDIRYDFEKGNLVHFGEFRIIGNSKTRDKVIRRELRVREGELYNGTRLRKSRERVERLGFFAPGEVVFNQITRKDNKDIVDIEISIKERSTGTVTLGMGYGSIQKFFFTTQVSEINLFGRGQNLSLSGQYASDRRSRSLSLGFTEPYTLDTLWSSGFDIFFISFPIPARYLQYKSGFNLRFGHPISDEINGFLVYKFEHLRLDQVRYDIDPNINVGDDTGNLSSVGFSIVRDRRNNRFETTKGDYQGLSTEFAGVGANKDFAKVIAEARYYTPVFDDLTFRTKIEVGEVFQTTDKHIPPSEKFYLGGPNNLKGFDPLTVSPRTGGGLPLGGAVEAMYIAELEFPLIREAGLKFVGFFDMGNSYANFRDFITFSQVKKDVGFGFRWFSPIGPLRFEWGFPINPVGFESDVVFNFFIGPPF